MKLIELTQGKQAIVDDEDYDRVNTFKWYAKKIQNHYYAYRGVWLNKKRETVTMHRYIMEAKDGNIFVDHKNGNGLDNQKSNLRFATQKQNQLNSASVKNSTSKYKGVHLCKEKNNFRVSIKKDGKNFMIGFCHDEIFCAKVYDSVARYYFKDFARCNFLEIFIEPTTIENARLLITEFDKENRLINNLCIKPVIIKGIEYQSIKEASNQLNIIYSTLYRRLNSKNYPDYTIKSNLF